MRVGIFSAVVSAELARRRQMRRRHESTSPAAGRRRARLNPLTNASPVADERAGADARNTAEVGSHNQRCVDGRSPPVQMFQLCQCVAVESRWCTGGVSALTRSPRPLAPVARRTAGGGWRFCGAAAAGGAAHSWPARRGACDTRHNAVALCCQLVSAPLPDSCAPARNHSPVFSAEAGVFGTGEL